MKIDSNTFRAQPRKALILDRQPTRINALCRSEKQYRHRLQRHVEHMSALQALLQASNRHALLLAF
ncbi:hypothetical protein VLK31_19375 [Variovorax sp. H27-G14]|uniref:hypothetical protein n=1 Tax=Variovorax sp. H27-G14 TaxID=3111914 RepID=UPI0038FD20F6